MIKVIKNFLPNDVFKEIHDKVFSVNFNWTLGAVLAPKPTDKKELDKIKQNQGTDNWWNTTCEEIYNWQLIHQLYESPGTLSSFVDIVNPVMKMIHPVILIRIKANLIPRADKIVEHGFHLDIDKSIPSAVTSILYLNTNNGHTLFEDGTKVPSVENTFVSFPSTMKHTGSTCTDVKYRGVINFNYIKAT